MPWWGIIYSILFAAVGFAAAFDRRVEGRFNRVAEVASTACGLTFLVAYFEPDVATSMGALIVPAFVGLLPYELYTGVKDLRAVGFDAELSPLENCLTRVVAVVFVLPPLVAGAILSVRHLGWL